MDKRKKKRYTVERRKKILKKLDEHGQVFVHELSQEFDVSEVTIRNDLELFESKKLLIRSRGGAIKHEGAVGFDFQLSEKDKMHISEKMRIGKKAADLIKNGETIILDSGTTTKEIAKNLNPEYTYNVITNAFNIANQLINTQNVNIIVPGGTMRKNSHSMVGPLAERSLRSFYVDKVFIGVDGIDPTHGVFTPNIEEASLNQVMIDISKEVILVTDSSKFGNKSLAFICPIAKIDIVVTDENIDKDDLKKLKDLGVKVIIA